MTEFKFNCARCGRRLKIDARFCGRQIRCPACTKVIEIPVSPDKPSDGAQAVVPARQGDVGMDARTLDAEPGRTNVYWKRKEPPTSTQAHTGSTDPSEL
jgi:DNA-directed RNA polymerase subunit RPC12/RpoP